ncbi:MAG TPA: radical SAM family heme chaperone HemW [Acidimicrobiia bacterium]|nr:radical SAM family heme chaperone HemW [Acidimicrobiia bacterium]
MISAASAAVAEASGLASAYVHIPFCARICPYCDFTVVAGRDDVVNRYISALRREIAESAPWRPLDAVFVGGGTPSRVGADRLGGLLEEIRGRHGIAIDAEVTLEANPEDVDLVGARALVAAGFTRISLGVQSFDDEVLADLGRVHDAERAVAAVGAALAAGFGSVSVDLIFGSPAESDSSWLASLRTAVDLEPHHVSTYALTVEPGTVLWKEVRHGASEPDADVQADRWDMAVSVLTAAGYERYEVSNHARVGHHCRYNAAVWAHAEYLAFGLGAHGYRNGVRTVNVRRLDTYLDRVERGMGPVQASEEVGGWAAEQERLLVGLRRTAGAVLGEGGIELLRSDWGRRLVDHGVVAEVDDRLVVTRPLLTDEVLRAILALEPPA